MRPVWAIAGLISLALGSAGVVLPLLPTVPFLLLSAFCFARSSPRLHGWLIRHPVLGPPIADWQRSGAIGRRAKWLASASILAAFGVSLALGVGTNLLLIQAIVLGCVTIFIWTRPDR